MDRSRAQNALTTVWEGILHQLHQQPDELFALCKHAEGEVTLSPGLQHILGPDGYGLVGPGQDSLDSETRAIIREAPEPKRLHTTD